MTDLDLGMNNWMAEPFPYPEKPIDRARSSDGGRARRARREVRIRALPRRRRRRHSVPHGARARPPPPPYFTRGSGHNDRAHYTERPDDYDRNMDRLDRKLETARDARSAARSSRTAPGARVGVIALRLLALRASTKRA